MIQRSTWDIYKENFLSRKDTISCITKFLSDTYGVSLKGYPINVVPNTRWKYKLDCEINSANLSNIVYINCYVNHNGESKPFICGTTKTGNCGTTDFNFNKNANDNRITYPITGRAFLKETHLDYDMSVIYLFGCRDKNEALLLERQIQHEFQLFGS